MWYEFVGGHNTKYRVPGVGDYERDLRAFRTPSSQSSSHSQSSQKRRMSTSDASEVAALREENRRVLEDNRSLRDEIAGMKSTQTSILEQLSRLMQGMGMRRPPGPYDDAMGGGHGFGVV